MRKLQQTLSGYVSVYFIIVIAGLFCFNAVLIDYVRMAIANRDTELAVKAGVRSTLAAYDTELQLYGLFGLNQSQAQSERLFREVVTNNLNEGLIPDAFTYTDSRLVDHGFSLDRIYTLGDHPVFKKQVLDEMKYQAPIELTLGLLNKFNDKDALERLKQADLFSKEAKHLDNVMQSREKFLDAARGHELKIKQTISSMYAQIKNNLEQIGSETELSLSGKVAALKPIISALSQQLSEVGSTANDEEERTHENSLNSIRSEILSYQRQVEEFHRLIQLIGDTKAEIEKTSHAMVDLQKQVNETLDLAQVDDDQIKLKKDELIASFQTGMSEEGHAEPLFEAVTIYGDAYFPNYKSTIERIQISLIDLKSRLSLEDLLIHYQSSQSAFNYIDQLEEQRERGGAAVKTEIVQQKKEAEAALKKANLQSDEVKEAGDLSVGAYVQLMGGDTANSEGLFQKYMKRNLMAWSGTTAAPRLKENVDDAYIDLEVQNGTFFNSFGSSIADTLLSRRNELFMNEYALTKFNYRTLHKASATVELTDSASHTLPDQEVEYMMYGFNSTNKNYAAAYAEMFTLRLAMRLTEFMIDPSKRAPFTATPWLLVLAALAYGAGNAYSDMTKLIQGEEVMLIHLPKSKALDKITLSYKDYLRVIMFMHSKDSLMMSRMQAIIELNTGRDLTQTSTYIQGTATTSLKVWFIPSLMKVLKISGLLEGRIRQNQYEISKTAAMSY